jgi:hypothetical protein
MAIGVLSATDIDRHGGFNVAGGLSAVVAGTVLGISRRDMQIRAEQRAETDVTEARADAEAARAELSGRAQPSGPEAAGHLAHTVSALSLQLEAAGLLPF